jgi:HEPN domain-containing protein
METREREIFSSYVSEVFRDQADRDYVAARALFRLGLYQQFYWSALQAVEKYFKGTLLFTGRPIHRYSHDASKAMQKVANCSEIGAAFPADVVEFIEELTVQGQNRYLEHTLYSEGPVLLRLDRTVWSVRRFCRDFLILPGDDEKYGTTESEERLRHSQEADPRNPTRFKLPGGYLERLIGGKRSSTRAALVWKNPFYCLRKRDTLRNYPVPISYHNPIHVMMPEILPILEKLVPFRGKILAELRDHAQEKLEHDRASKQ